MAMPTRATRLLRHTLSLLIVLHIIFIKQVTAVAVYDAKRIRQPQATTPHHGSSTAPSDAASSQTAWWNGCKNGLASALSAACAKTVLQPLDAIKTMQQVAVVSNSHGASRLTIVGACRELARRPGGLSNFYSGLGVSAIGSMPGVAIYFGVYSYCKQRLLNATFQRRNNDSFRLHPTLAVALSAAIGNTVASVSRVPYEVVKQQLQTGQYDSTWQALSAIAKSPDWYRKMFPKGGIASQMLRDVPYAIVTLVCYEHLQERYGSNSWKRQKAMLETQPARSRRKPAVSIKTPPRQSWDFLLGGIAGGIGSWATSPLDVIKTRLQTDPVGAASMYQGSLSKCFQLTLQEGGLSAFMRGSLPRIAHKIPANAFFFLFYEGFRRLLRVQDTTSTATENASSVRRKR
ncbi:hypothetical protein MPSEU_000397200 [Mayamaea pseudoterrestris]|nr:hypothetical protein MPSEU_000397200 [Mayamaea pseudoterrestris]